MKATMWFSTRRSVRGRSIRLRRCLRRASRPGLVTKLGGVAAQKPAERLGVQERQHCRHPAAQVLLEMDLCASCRQGKRGCGEGGNGGRGRGYLFGQRVMERIGTVADVAEAPGQPGSFRTLSSIYFDSRPLTERTRARTAPIVNSEK